MSNSAPFFDELEKVCRDPSVEHDRDQAALHASAHTFANSGVPETETMAFCSPRCETRKLRIEIQHQLGNVVGTVWGTDERELAKGLVHASVPSEVRAEGS